MNEMVKTVSFAGKELDCVQKEDGEVFVSLRRACENIGIDYSGQLQKLKEQHWARVELIPTRDSWDRHQEMTMINLDTLAMWLATIQSGRVSEDARPQLELYQKEVVKVIRQYFFPVQQPVTQMTPMEIIQQIVNSSVDMERRQLATESQLAAQEQNLLIANEKLNKVEEAIGNSISHIPAKTMRANLNLIIRQSGSSADLYASAWSKLYREFRDRYTLDIKAKARNAKMKNLDWAEKYGHLPNLYQLAVLLYGEPS